MEYKNKQIGKRKTVGLCRERGHPSLKSLKMSACLPPGTMSTLREFYGYLKIMPFFKAGCNLT